MIECSICNKDLMKDEVRDLVDTCYQCHITVLCKSIANELREARITFEEVMRKIMVEVDK